MKNTGFIVPKLDSTQYIMGAATSLSKNILQADGQWGAYLPSEERQHQPGFDTYNCTSFGTLNCYEILFNKIYGKQENKSDRFLGIMAGTRPPGNSPHIVAEAARKNGLIPEPYLGFDDDIDTVNEYYSFIFADEKKCINEGKNFLTEYTLGHEWVFTGGASKTNRTALMKEALKYSPLGVSVSGWNYKDGVYVDMGQPNNHWTVIYGYNEQGWLCFDSYAPYTKIVSYDHDISYCKRYSLTPTGIKKDNWLIALIKSVIAKIKPKTKVPDLPQITPDPPQKSPRERLYDSAVACLGTDISPLDKANDELACAESVNCVHFHAFKEFIEGTPGVSTTKLFAALVDRADKWVRVTDPEPGNIIISPTGFSTASHLPIRHGHVGIFGKDLKIMSNSSETGKFEENYTLDLWVDRYRNKGGYPIYMFKRI